MINTIGKTLEDKIRERKGLKCVKEFEILVMANSERLIDKATIE